MKTYFLVFLCCLLCACSSESLETVSEAEPETIVAPLIPIVAPEAVAESDSERASESEQPRLLVEGAHPILKLDTAVLPFSPFYRVFLELFREGEKEPIFKTHFFPAEQSKQLFLISSEGLQKGDRYTLELAGRFPENDCLTDWKLLLVSEPGAGLPGSGNTVYRLVEQTEILLGQSDFQRDAADLNCSFIYEQEGYVKDVSGNSLKDVVVRAEVRQRDGSLAYLNQQLTDQSGHFYFKDLPVGVFTWLVIKQPGYLPVERTFSSQFNANGELQQRLQFEITLEKVKS